MYGMNLKEKIRNENIFKTLSQYDIIGASIKNVKEQLWKEK